MSLGEEDVNDSKLNWTISLRYWRLGICDWSPILAGDGG